MISGFFAALRFLTVVPLPGKIGADPQSLSNSLPFFPLVGLLIGCVIAGPALFLSTFFPPILAAVLIVALLLTASAALHMDGLCDTADGFFSSRPKEQMLLIMRDSRVGAMGVLAMMLVLSAKIAALTTLIGPLIWLPVICMPLAGRAILVLLIATMPYARSEGGMASAFFGEKKYLTAWLAIVFLSAACWFLAGYIGLLVVAAVLIFNLGFAIYCRRKIDGITGDTLGAACELTETLVAVILAAKPVLELLGEMG